MRLKNGAFNVSMDFLQKALQKKLTIASFIEQTFTLPYLVDMWFKTLLIT